MILVYQQFYIKTLNEDKQPLKAFMIDYMYLLHEDESH